MRRTLLILLTALATLAACQSAGAVINRYTAKLSFPVQRFGSVQRPAPTGFTEDLGARGTNGNRTGVIQDITTKVYGLQSGLVDFPGCPIKQIRDTGSDASCPAGALVATGAVTGTIGVSDNYGLSGPACDPAVHVWNQGGSRLALFFVENRRHTCLGGALKTGAVGPFTADVAPQGRYLVIDVHIPVQVSYPFQFSAFSLSTLHLSWLTQTTAASGGTVSSLASAGCRNGVRPYSVSYTATLPGAHAPVQTTTVGRSAICRAPAIPKPPKAAKKKHPAKQHGG